MREASIVRHRQAGLVVLAATVLLASAPLAGQEGGNWQPLGSLRVAAESRLRSQLRGVPYDVRVQVAEPDPRLHLQRCPGALAASPVGQSELAAHVTVRVSCGGERAIWSVFLPVTLESDVPVLVLRQSQARGARLGPQDVSVETRRVPGLGAAYLTEPGALAHRSLLRTIPPGTALTADLFASDFLVRQGQSVTLVAAGPGIEVRAPARALEDAREGSPVRVQNLSSQRVVQGIVEPSGLIRATP
jgi:flagellar basal body P-ring formation protein FlgA